MLFMFSEYDRTEMAIAYHVAYGSVTDALCSIEDTTVSTSDIFYKLRKALYEISEVLLVVSHSIVPDTLDARIQKLNRPGKSVTIPRECESLSEQSCIEDRELLSRIGQTLDCFIVMIGQKYGSLVKDSTYVWHNLAV